MGRPRRLRRRHREASRGVRAPRDARGSALPRPAAVAVLPAAERKLAVPLGEEPAGGRGGLRAAGVRRRGLGHAAGAVELAGRRRERGTALRPALLHQHQAPVPGRPAARAPRRQPHGALPDALRGAGRLEGPPRPRPLRGRAVGVLRVAERQEARLPRGLLHAGRVRPHAPPRVGRERPRRPGDPPLGRQLPGGPGLLAPRRDLPRRLPPRPAAGAAARLRGAHRPRRRLPRRDARAARGPRESVECGGRRPPRDGVGARCRRGRGLLREAGRRRRAAGGRRGGGDGLGPRAGAAALVGRDAEPLHARARAPRRGGGGPGGRLHPHRLPRGGDQGRAAAAERGRDHVQGREPPRVRPRPRPRRLARADARGRPPDEAAQLQRGAHLALPERPALAGAVRRVRPVRRRRGERREPRAVGEEDLHRRRPGVDGGLRRPGGGDGRARQEPPVRRLLVDGERDRARPQLRRDVRGDEDDRPHAADPLREPQPSLRAHPVELRHHLDDVPHGRARPRPDEPGPDAARHHLRVRARHGQRPRELLQVLGRVRQVPPPAGRLHLGLGGPGAAPPGAGWPCRLELGEHQRRRQRQRRARERRPHAAAGDPRGEEGPAAGEGRGRGRGPRARAGDERPRLRRSLGARARVAAARGRRRRAVGNLGGAARHPGGREPRAHSPDRPLRSSGG